MESPTLYQKVGVLEIIAYIYLPTPPHEQDATQGQFFKRSLTGFEFRVFLLLDWLPSHG